MAGGMRYDSLADMPAGMRKLLENAVRKETTGESLQEAYAAAATKTEKAASKYGNEPVMVSGIRFDSKKEARRYQILMDYLSWGVIRKLHLQQTFTLQEAYTTEKGERIRAITYKADFTYEVIDDRDDRILPEDMECYRELYPGCQVVEDVKSRGTRTDKYIMKRKMMAERGHPIREI